VYLSSINGYECLTMEQMAPCVKIVRNVLNFWVYARWGGRGKTNMAEWSQEGVEGVESGRMSVVECLLSGIRLLFGSGPSVCSASPVAAVVV